MGVADLHFRVWQPTLMKHGCVRKAYGLLFSSLFLNAPACDPRNPSLVYEDERGRISGFLGVTMRPMRFRQERVSMAVGTQFMIERGVPQSVPMRMARRAMRGPQDLTYLDMANPRGLRFATALGFSRIEPFSRHWLRPLRPARLAGALIRRRQASKQSITTPSRTVGDIDSAQPYAVVPGLTPERLSAMAWRDDLHDLLIESLCPVYSHAWSNWLYQRLQNTFEGGSVRSVLYRSEAGRTVGWYVYQCIPGDIGQVAQLVAEPGRERELFNLLLRDASSHGLAALTGRFHPRLLPALKRSGCLPLRRGDVAVAFSSRPELLAALQSGDAFLSRLEGEGAVNLHLASAQLGDLRSDHAGHVSVVNPDLR
ncbi:MAG: hypothetical protein AAGF84_04060 [Planctomycetota bacterium]